MVMIGENSYVNGTAILVEHPPHTITIGDNCAVGHWVYMSTKMHKTDNHLEYFDGDIIIENNVWIGNGAVIYPNVKIGHHSVIGAQCVIKHNLKPYRKIQVVQQEEYDFDRHFHDQKGMPVINRFTGEIKE